VLLPVLPVRGGSRKKYLGAWPLIVWEATTVKRNYYKTNYIKHVEKLDLNYPEKNLRGPGQDLVGPVPPGPNVEPPLTQTVRPSSKLTHKMHVLGMSVAPKMILVAGNCAV